MNTQLQILGELFEELVVFPEVLDDLRNQVDDLLHKVLFDDFKDFVLLERLSGDVQGQVLRGLYALDEKQPLSHEVLTVVHEVGTAAGITDGTSVTAADGTTVRIADGTAVGIADEITVGIKRWNNRWKYSWNSRWNHS